MKVFECRLCKGNLSEPKLKFPSTPLANEFVETRDVHQDVFPLEVCVCELCGHYQLNEQVDPERMFRHYLFVAGTSPINVEHFKNYANHMVEKFKLQPGSQVLDIASNDGVLLKEFKKLGMGVLGIDPAKNIAAVASAEGIETIAEFFTEDLAHRMTGREFDLITANNVFAHVPDMIGFTKGVKKLLAPKGIYTFEVSYFGDVAEKLLFDTIYHEHTSYHTIKPLFNFFETHGLLLFKVERIETHGGSIRCYVCHDNSEVRNKLHHLDLSSFPQEKSIVQNVSQMQKCIRKLGNRLGQKMSLLKLENKSIAIFGTPAKATTLMYGLGIDPAMIDFAVDDAPLKQGRFTPGMHIPIFHPNAIYEKKPDVLLVLAWNFADSIIKNHAEFGGKWIVPIPELKEI